MNDLLYLNERARTIVELAATLTEVESVQHWLHCDEKGTWEKTVKDLLEQHKDKIAAANEEQVNLEAARYVVYLAVSATLNNKKKQAKR